MLASSLQGLRLPVCHHQCLRSAVLDHARHKAIPLSRAAARVGSSALEHILSLYPSIRLLRRSTQHVLKDYKLFGAIGRKIMKICLMKAEEAFVITFILPN
jgi:hypothetical protein